MIGPNRLNLSAKQMAKLVAKMKPITSNNTVIDKENVCLMWVGRYDDYGRPIFSVKGKYKLAKKLIYESWYGPIDGDKTVINTCFNLQCVRPNHLTQSFYFFQETKARDGKKDPKNRRKRWIIKVTEKIMLKVFNGIKCGRLKSISDIGKFMNVDDSDVIEYLLNDNWMYINKYYTKVELDQLRAKVMPETINDINKHIKIERFCNDFFKSW